jgi:hypothetical protein
VLRIGKLPDNLHAALSQFLSSRQARATIPSRILDALRLRRSGSITTIELGTSGDFAEQTMFWGTVVTDFIAGVRIYINHAKQAEARNALAQLGKDGAAWFEREEFDPKSHKALRHDSCPPVAPRTPAAVPRGAKYTSAAADWQRGGWKALGFQMNDAQYYSYGIDRSADGKTCTYYAEGDLNGDGVTSRFELVAQIVKDGRGHRMQLAPTIVETRADE